METEHIENELLDLDLRSNGEILETLLSSQRRAVKAVENAKAELDKAIAAAASRLIDPNGRLVLAGAGASGRLAVQDGAEMWPTFGWPHERLILCMAGGESALLQSVEGIEDDSQDAMEKVRTASLGIDDVVLCLAASGRSPWTCSFLKTARDTGALTIGFSNNPDTPLLANCEHPVWLDSGPEVLAGSTRMAAGTAQKIALNVFSTTLMIRLNRTYGNLMVDMAAVNQKLDKRRVHLLKGVVGEISDTSAHEALQASGGWVKLAVLIAKGCDTDSGRQLLLDSKGSLRTALAQWTKQDAQLNRPPCE